MRRSAFTMIELIFVIVILGILAAVALPRFASIQDDANIAAEKSTIGSVRSGLQAVRGRVLANTNRDLNITFTDGVGGWHVVNLQRQIASTANGAANTDQNVSSTGYPNAISLKAWVGAGDPSKSSAKDETANVARASGDSTTQGAVSGVLLLEEGRDSITTYDSVTPLNSAGATPAPSALMITSGGLSTVILGQATKSINDPSVELCAGRGWIYNSVSGGINLAGACNP